MIDIKLIRDNPEAVFQAMEKRGEGRESIDEIIGLDNTFRRLLQEAEALREKRARIIKAEAEYEAALKLREAADEIMKTPASLELRRMQMLTEIGAEQNTMTVVMMPSEFVEAARALARKP